MYQWFAESLPVCKIGWLILAPNTKLSWMAISIKVFGIKVLFKFKFLPEDANK